MSVTAEPTDSAARVGRKRSGTDAKESKEDVEHQTTPQKKGKHVDEDSDDADSAIDSKMCQVCRSGEEDERSLLCDMCNEAYHTFCLSPPLKKVPRGDWYCPKCENLIHAEQGGAPSSGTRASRGSPRTAKRARPAVDEKSGGSEEVRSPPKKKTESKKSPKRSTKKVDNEADDDADVNVDDDDADEKKSTPVVSSPPAKTEGGEQKRGRGRPRKNDGNKKEKKEDASEESSHERKGNIQSLELSEKKRKKKTDTSVKEDASASEEDDDDEPKRVGPCRICNRRAANDLLVCDAEGCDNAFHTFCLNPPLPGVPSSKWYCPTCTLGAKGRDSKLSRTAVAAAASRKGTLLAKAKKEAAERARNGPSGKGRKPDDEDEEEENNDEDEEDEAAEEDDEENEEEEDEYKGKRGNLPSKRSSRPSRRSGRSAAAALKKKRSDDDDSAEDEDEGEDNEEDEGDDGGDVIDFNEIDDEPEEEVKKKSDAKKVLKKEQEAEEEKKRSSGPKKKPSASAKIVKKEKKANEDEAEEEGESGSDEEDDRPIENDGGALLSEFQRIVATPNVMSSPSAASSSAAAQSVMALDDILSSMSSTRPPPQTPVGYKPQPLIATSASTPRDLLVAAAAAAPDAPNPVPSQMAISPPPPQNPILRSSRDLPATGASSPPPTHPTGSSSSSANAAVPPAPLHTSLNSSGEKLPASSSAGTEKTVQVWKGGLRFDDKFICNAMGYAKVSSSAPKPLISWPDPLVCFHSILPSHLPPASLCTVVSLLPEKDLVPYNQLLATLDKNLWVAEGKLRSAHVFLMSSTQLPAGYTIPLAQKAASLVAIHIPITNPLPKQPQLPSTAVPLPNVSPMTQQGGAPSLPLAAGAAAVVVPPLAISTFVPNPAAGPPGPWMKNMSFALMGYRKEEIDRMKPLTQFLVSSSGVYKQPGPDVNIIAVNPQHLHKISEEKNLLECKLSPAIFLRGLKHLEDCAERRQWTEPAPAQILFPQNSLLILLQLDSILSNDVALPQILDQMATQAKVTNQNAPSGEHLGDWIVKVHPDHTKIMVDLKPTSQRAKKGLDAIEKHTKTGLVELIAPTEESHTFNSAWVQLPPAFRNAMKMSYQYAARFRHVILVTQNAELQQLAKGQQLLAFDLLAFGDFITQQIAQQYASQPRKPVTLI